jgi:hypothetical protein
MWKKKLVYLGNFVILTSENRYQYYMNKTCNKTSLSQLYDKAGSQLCLGSILGKADKPRIALVAALESPDLTPVICDPKYKYTEAPKVIQVVTKEIA